MFLIKKIKKFKKRIALIGLNGNEISYSQLDKISETYSNLIESNKLIFIIGGYSEDIIFFYISALKKNCLVKFLNPSINKNYLKTLIRKFKPHYIVNDNKKNEIKNFKKIYKTTNNVILLKKNKWFKFNINPKLMFIQSTSGSTGSAKCVKLTKKNIEINTNDICKSLKIKKNHTTVTTLPISYVYGLSIINTHLFVGARIILNNATFFEKKFWNLFSLFKISSFGGVPYNYDILDKLGFFEKKIYFKNLSYTTVAGGKISLELLKKINKFYKLHKTRFYNMYGASEASARMSLLDWKYSEKKIGSIGKPIGKGKFLLKVKNKIHTRSNFKGKLLFKGQNIYTGYAYDYKSLSFLQNIKILNTDDTAIKDKDNFYYIISKQSRFTKIFGNRLNLDELDELFKRFKVKSISKSFVDNKIIVFIEKQNEKKINFLKRKFIDYTKLNINTLKFKIIKKIPINNNGKIDFNNPILKNEN